MKRKRSEAVENDAENPQPEKKSSLTINEPIPSLSVGKFKKELLSENAIDALKTFNKLCRLYEDEDIECVDILKPYVLSSPECEEIFKYIKTKPPVQDLVVVFQTLLHIVARTSKDPQLKTICNKVCSNFISNYFSQVEYCLGNFNPSVICAALKLLTAIVLQGKNFSKEIALKINTNSVALTNISKFRYKSDLIDETLSEVRTNFVHFILSFLVLDDEKTLQFVLESTSFIELVFKNMVSDPLSLVKRTLTAFGEKVVRNISLSKTAKVNLFGGKKTLLNIAALFTWGGLIDLKDDDGVNALNDVRKITFDFLVYICCSLKHGINFLDKSYGISGRMVNKKIMDFITNLQSPEKDPMMRQLISQCLASCPDLMKYYFKNSLLKFDPGTPDHWNRNCAFLREIFEGQPTLPAPLTKYVAGNQGKYTINDIAKMISITLLPSVITQGLFKTALKSSNILATKEALLIAQMILNKYNHIKLFLKDSDNIKHSQFSNEDLNKLQSILDEMVLEVVPSLTTLCNLCVNNETNKDNICLAIRHEVVMCISAYSEVFLEVFVRSPFDYSSLLGGLMALPEVQEMKSKMALFDSTFSGIMQILLKNFQAYKWFKTGNKHQSPFYYLLLMFTGQHVAADVKELAWRLVKEVLIVNLIYGQHNVDEFKIWTDSLKICSSEKLAICLEFVSNNIRLIALKPHKYQSSDNYMHEKVTEPTKKDSDWWENIPLVSITKQSEKTPKKTSSQQEVLENTTISPLVLATLEKISNMKYKKIIDKYVSMVFLHLIHSTQSLSVAKIYVPVYMRCCKSEEVRQNYKFLNGTFTYFQQILGEKCPATKDVHSGNKKSTSQLMNWFCKIVMKSSTKPEKCSVNSTDVFADCKSDTSQETCYNLTHNMNQLLLYLDIVVNLPHFTNGANSKVYCYQICKLMFDLIVECNIEGVDATPLQNILFDSKLLWRNFLSKEAESSLLSDIINPKMLQCLGNVDESERTEAYFDKFAVTFLTVATNVSEDAFKEGHDLEVIKALPILSKSMKLDHLINILNALAGCLSFSGSQIGTIISLFHQMLEHTLSKLDENQFCETYLTFPNKRVVKSACEWITSDCILNDTREALLNLLLVLLEKFTTKVVKNFPKGFIEWCFANINNKVGEVLKFCAVDSGNMKTLISKVQKYLSKSNSFMKAKLAPCLTQALKTCFSNKNDENTAISLDIVKFVLSEYSYLLGNNFDEYENWDIKVYGDFVTVMLVHIANSQDRSLEKATLKGLKSKSSVQNLNWLKYFLVRLECIFNTGLIQESDKQHFVKNCMKTVFDGIKTLESSKANRNEHKEDVSKLYKALTSMIKFATESDINLKEIIAPYWNNFFIISLKYEIQNQSVINILALFVKSLYPSENKDLLSISDAWKMVTGHSKFLEIVCGDAAESSSKAALIELMQVIRNVHTEFVANDCIFLLGSYEATLKIEDLTLLKILKQYEDEDVDMSNFKPFLWGKLAMSEYTAQKELSQSVWKKPGLDQVVACLNSEMMSQTLTNFPIRRRISQTSSDDFVKTTAVYDPAFLLPLFHELLDPKNYVDCRLFVSERMLSFILMSLASHCEIVRSLAASCLGLFYKHVESEIFSEKNFVLYILQLLRNEIKVTKRERPIISVNKISTVVAKFLAKTVEVMFNPRDHMYGIICKYLLIKPRLDLHCVPEFYVLFFSSTMEHKVERQWIISLLAESMADMSDFHLIEKRKLCKTFLSFYSSPVLDNHSRKLILQTVGEICKINGAAAELLLTQGLLSWLYSLVCSEQVDKNKPVEFLQQIVEIIHNLSEFATDDKLKKKRPEVILTSIKELTFVILEKILQLWENHNNDDSLINRYKNLSMSLIKITRKCVENLSNNSSFCVEEMLILHKTALVSGDADVVTLSAKVLLSWQHLPNEVLINEISQNIILWVLKQQITDIGHLDYKELTSLCKWLQCWVPKFENNSLFVFLLNDFHCKFTLSCVDQKMIIHENETLVHLLEKC